MSAAWWWNLMQIQTGGSLKNTNYSSILFDYFAYVFPLRSNIYLIEINNSTHFRGYCNQPITTTGNEEKICTQQICMKTRPWADVLLTRCWCCLLSWWDWLLRRTWSAKNKKTHPKKKMPPSWRHFLFGAHTTTLENYLSRKKRMPT